MASADSLTRRVIPRLVVALSRLDGLAHFGAVTRRGLGRRGRVELFFAFDDPCSAVAVLDLATRTAGRDVRLLLEPVVERGIADDPAVEAKRRYAIDDARRLGRRFLGLSLSRTEPVPAGETAFLAAWASAIPAGPAQTRFCVEAMRELWFGSDGAIDPAPYAAMWETLVGSPPPTPPVPPDEAVRGNERRMKRRGPYDTPAAWVHGQWFFAHDRLVQIGDRLDDLGWTEQR
jgi:2-hydroxychromene-2-carboxylate isomerase